MSFLKQRGYLLSVVAIGAVLAFAACGGGNNESAGTTSPGASGAPSDLAPDSDQKMTMNIRAEPNTIDPQGQSYTYEATVVKNTYITLFDQDPKTTALTAYAAQDVPTKDNGGISSDGLTYTIKLRSGLKWSDGTPLTAADFVYGIIRGYNLNVSGAGYGGFITAIKGAKEALALDPKSATYVADVNAALKDSIVAVDDTTLKFVLANASVSFPYNLFLPITAAVKKSNVDALGDSFGQAAGAGQMITSGPFVVTEWAPKDHITMVRNENFTARHTAYLKQITAKVIEDRVQAYNAFQAGQIDLTEVPATVYPGVKDDPRVHQESEFGTRWITVDATLPPWNNKDFVIGINQATDREALARDVFFGTYKAYFAPCADTLFACDPSLFSNLDFNLDKAKASIVKAYPDGNIPDVTLDTLDDATSKATVTTLQSQWKQVGVNVKIVTTDQKTLRADLKNHVSGTQITGWGMDYGDPTDLWSIKTKDQIGANNLGFYDRPGYDALENKQDTTYDPNQRKDILTQLQQFYAADPADITFGVKQRTDIVNPKLKGLVTSSLDYEIFGDQFLADIYVSK